MRNQKEEDLFEQLSQQIHPIKGTELVWMRVLKKLKIS